MDDEAIDVERLSAALLELEEEINWDAVPMLDRAVRLEEQAHAAGDPLLIARAQLSQANLHMRAGDVTLAAKSIWKVHQWAVENHAKQLTARTHLVWSNIHRHLGDAAQCLEHAVLAVELLDETSTVFMRMWHRNKLADALSLSGSLDAARQRYQQAVAMAIEHSRPDVVLAVLNNYAYAEYSSGNRQRAQEVADQLQKHAADYGFELDATLLDTIGCIQVENGQFAEAEQTLQAAIAKHRSGPQYDADELPGNLLTLARAQRGLGAFARAQDSLDESRRLCVERELARVLVSLHQEQAELHAARGEFADAFAVHKIFFDAFNNLHSKQREAQARTRQAMFETTEARQEAERFREQARRDPLTGLRNRRYVDEQLPGLMETDPRLTVAIVDLDHFKRINDQFSHDIGDQVLIRVAKLLDSELAAVSPEGFAARLGGEEFLLVLPGMSSSVAVRRLERIRRAIAGCDWNALTRGLPVTVSIGVAGRDEVPAASQAGLLSIADKNLYAAKHGGRDRVVSGLPRVPESHSYRDSASAA